MKIDIRNTVDGGAGIDHDIAHQAAFLVIVTGAIGFEKSATGLEIAVGSCPFFAHDNQRLEVPADPLGFLNHRHNIIDMGDQKPPTCGKVMNSGGSPKSILRGMNSEIEIEAVNDIACLCCQDK